MEAIAVAEAEIERGRFLRRVGLGVKLGRERGSSRSEYIKSGLLRYLLRYDPTVQIIQRNLLYKDAKEESRVRDAKPFYAGSV